MKIEAKIKNRQKSGQKSINFKKKIEVFKRLHHVAPARNQKIKIVFQHVSNI